MQHFTKQTFKKSAIIGLFLAVNLTTPTYAVSLGDLFGKTTSQNSKILPVHQAFQVLPTQKNNVLQIRIEIQDGYYAYQDKLKLDLPEGVTASPFSYSITPNFVDDPDFGRVKVFEETVTATTTLSTQKNIDNADITIRWQGCAKAGLCYPPEKVAFNIKNLSANLTEQPVTSAEKTQQPITAVASQTTLTEKTQETNEQIASTAVVQSVASVSQGMASAPTPVLQKTEQSSDFELNSTENADIFGLATHTPLALLLLFLAGLGLAFTPCVLPMLPIVANIVARQHNPSAKKGLLLTGGYGLGVATSYGLIGALIAVFGGSLGVMSWLQNPTILLSFAGLFVLLGLYMLDLLPIRLPARLSMKLQGLTQVGENRLGSITGSFITGFFSALVVSPCVSAPLAGALAGVATLGNPVIGFFALFMLGLGLSTPLILLGATQGNFMPKAGEWMNWVKSGFALMMFAVSLLMIERVFVSSLMLALWALWFAVVAMWAWQWAGRGQVLSRAVALLLAVWTVCLLVGVAMGSRDSWQPLKVLTQQQSANISAVTNKSMKIYKLSELEPILQTHQNVLVDVTADWCIECRIMDKTLFANPPATLANWQVVKLDVTENTPDSKQVYEKLQVFGPPVLLYFQNGKLVARQNGETKRADFEQILTKLTP